MACGQQYDQEKIDPDKYNDDVQVEKKELKIPISTLNLKIPDLFFYLKSGGKMDFFSKIDKNSFLFSPL